MPVELVEVAELAAAVEAPEAAAGVVVVTLAIGVLATAVAGVAAGVVVVGRAGRFVARRVETGATGRPSAGAVVVVGAAVGGTLLLVTPLLFAVAWKRV